MFSPVRLFFLVLTMAYISILSAPAYAEEPAEEPSTIQEKKQIFENLPPEEQEAILEEVKEKVANFQNLPPEEKKAAIQDAASKRYDNLPEEKKAKVDARREKAQSAKTKYDGLPEEKKAKIKEKREKIKEKRAAGGGGGIGKRFKDRQNQAH